MPPSILYLVLPVVIARCPQVSDTTIRRHLFSRLLMLAIATSYRFLVLPSHALLQPLILPSFLSPPSGVAGGVI